MCTLLGLPYMAVSAKDGTNIEDAFEKVFNLIDQMGAEEGKRE